MAGVTYAGAAGLSFCASSFSSCSSSGFRSTFFAAPRSLRLIKSPRRTFLRRDVPVPHPSRNYVAHSTSSAISALIGSEIYDSIAHLQVGILQKTVDLGFTIPTNEETLTWSVIALPAVMWYLMATPGSLAGLLDFASAPVHSFSNISFHPEEVEVGRQIGQGSFGVVYEGYIGRGKKKASQKRELRVILKKVKPRSRGAIDMHNAEVHMNRRVKRTAPNACADFLGTTEVSSSQAHGRLSEGLWVVWRFEGDKTLDFYMKQKNFPQNLSKSVLGSKVGVSKPEIVEQNNAVIRKIATQILTCLRDLHKTGLVHRDVKPLNLIFAEDSGTFKLVDLGAAVDLRTGYNYVPEETIMDPNYAAPEHHVMPTSTPQLPPDPLCSAVSPLVWLLNTPDRFDLFSVGLIILQMSVKPLRHDIGLQSFNAEFKRASYNLDAWRSRCRFSDQEFSLLDADGAAGWDLVRSMLQPRHDKAFLVWPSLGSSRPSAAAALRHRFFTGSFVKLPSFSIPKHKFLEFPLPLQPGNPVPNFAYDHIPKLGVGGTRPTMDSRQVVEAVRAVMPTVAISGLTLATGWMILSALRDSAQKSYDVGYKAMETLGIGGFVLVASFLFVRLLDTLERKASSHKLDAQLRRISLATVDVGTSSEDEYIPSHLQQLKPNSSISGHDDVVPQVENDAFVEAIKIDPSVRHTVRSMDAAKIDPAMKNTVRIRNATKSDPVVEYTVKMREATKITPAKKNTVRIRALLNNGTHSRPKGTATGLAEAVRMMESQLASLESSIDAGRLFAEKQQKQILQMEKLLNHSQEPVSSGKQSNN